MKNILIAAVVLASSVSFAQGNQLPDMSDTLENMRARDAAVEKILKLQNGSEVLQQLTRICEHVVFSKKEKQNQVDILSPIDVELCRSELVIALAKYAEEKK